MFENVVVGVHEPESGRDAVALANNVGANHARLTLAYVYPGEPAGGRRFTPPLEAQDRAWGQELLEKVAGDTSAAVVLRLHRSPSVGRGLHEITEEIGADLLVVGSSRRGLLGRVFLGDDTRAALNGAPCATAIAPAGYASGSPLVRAIGVGYDGSPESRRGLEVARSLAETHNAKLSALRVVAIPAYVLGIASMVPEGELETLLAEARKELQELGDLEPHATYGQPAEELAVFSARLDLLVVGSRSYGPLGRVVHGSTSQQLARTARCPLLVLPRSAAGALPADAPEAGELEARPRTVAT